MINEDKVVVMTRMAAYEARQGKKDLKICSSFRSDYIGAQLLKTWLCCTLSFCLLAVIDLMFEMDSFTELIYGFELKEALSYGRQLLIVYLIFCAFFLVITYCKAHIDYRNARRNLSNLNRALRMVGSDEEPAEGEE